LHRGTRCYCKLAEAPFANDSQLRLSLMCHISALTFVVLSHAVLALKHALRCAVFPGALWDHARKCPGHGGKHKLPAVMHHVLQISVACAWYDIATCVLVVMAALSLLAPADATHCCRYMRAFEQCSRALVQLGLHQSCSGDNVQMVIRSDFPPWLPAGFSLVSTMASGRWLSQGHLSWQAMPLLL
jgi:hypothetical protein